MYSPLCAFWYTSPNRSSREDRPVSRITVHHTAGICSTIGLLRMFHDPARRASANYVIGNTGSVGGCVPEEDRSWCSNSRDNDTRAITIEVSNDVNSEPWSVSDAAWKATVELCVDICLRYGFKLWWDPEKQTGSLTAHRWFANTACPGDWLYARFPDLIKEVNEMVDKILKLEEQLAGLQLHVQRLEELVLPKWQTLTDLPDYYFDTIKKLVDDGAILGTGDGLNINEIMARTLTVCDREGAFNNER